MPIPSKRMAYQVVIDVGRDTRHIGNKGRLVSRRRANRICKFLTKRGHDVWMRRFGTINIYPGARLFD